MSDNDTSALLDEIDRKLRDPQNPPRHRSLKAALRVLSDKPRANYIPAPHYFNLNQACRVLVDAFGSHIYLVGSSIDRRDFRDVDVRCILPDEDYAKLFPGLTGNNPSWSALWSVMCSSISLWLSQHSGLPIDFQIQQETEANAGNNGPRQPLGLFYATPTPSGSGGAP